MSRNRETVDLTDPEGRVWERNRVAWNLPHAVPAAGKTADPAPLRSEARDADDESTTDG